MQVGIAELILKAINIEKEIESTIPHEVTMYKRHDSLLRSYCVLLTLASVFRRRK